MPKGLKGKVVNKSELAAIVGVEMRQLQVWQGMGMPFTAPPERGGKNEYNTCEVIRWMITRESHGGLDLDHERAKLAREQSEMAAMKKDALRGDLISVKDAVTVAGRAAAAIRQKIVNSQLPEEDKKRLLEDIHALGETEFTAAGVGVDDDDDKAPITAE